MMMRRFPPHANSNRKVPIGKAASSEVDEISAYRAVSQAGECPDLLDTKTRELIALSAAVLLGCDIGISVHAAKAVRDGATPAEIAEALGIVTAVNAAALLIGWSRNLNAASRIAARVSFNRSAKKSRPRR
jgi:AhpD family alkylhydroperoxidase